MERSVDLAHVRALLEAATQGTWTVEPHGKTLALYAGRDDQHHGLRLLNLDDGDRNISANADLIAAAPSLLAAMADEIERLRASPSASQTALARALPLLVEMGHAHAASLARHALDETHPAVTAIRAVESERDRLRADNAAMLAIVEAAAEARFTDAALEARRYFDARR